MRSLTPSATLAINERARSLEAEGRSVYKFGFGQSPFPIPEPVVAELRKSAHHKDYLPVSGLPALKEAVADYHSASSPLGYSSDEVLIGPGSKELMFILQVVFDGVLNLSSPSWVSYAPQGKIADSNVQWSFAKALDDWFPTPDDLDSIGANAGGRAQMIILNYPSNPAGTTLGRAQLADLAEAARRNRILVLSDEIYGELHHTGEHTSIAEYYPEGTIISSGLSKWCGAGGWRLGTFTFPRSLVHLRNAMTVVASESFSATSSPVQYAAVEAYLGGAYVDTYLSTCRMILRELCSEVAHELQSTGASVRDAKGGFYLFPDFSPLRETLQSKGVTTSSQMCEQLIEETGVMMLPGSVFGRPAEELTARLAYVDFDGQQALEAEHSVEAVDHYFIGRYCSKTLEGVNRLGSWLAE